MIYLISKIIAYLLTSLAIGFGMGWFVQFSQAKRLREQLNGVIFETKSRIPQLETAITSRDQKIEQLSLELAESSDRSKNAASAGDSRDDSNANGAEKVAASTPLAQDDKQLKEYETKIAELQRTVTELTTELDLVSSMTAAESDSNSSESATETTQSLEPTANPENFLDEIRDIFDADEGELSASPEMERIAPSAEKNVVELARPAFVEEIAKAPATSRADDAEVEALRLECENLNSLRRKLTETVDSQTRELEQIKEQQILQDKSLTVLNQQLELSRLANERIVRELQTHKNAAKSDDDEGSQSASA